jgi:hypothetical protein
VHILLDLEHLPPWGYDEDVMHVDENTWGASHLSRLGEHMEPSVLHGLLGLPVAEGSTEGHGFAFGGGTIKIEVSIFDVVEGMIRLGSRYTLSRSGMGTRE